MSSSPKPVVITLILALLLGIGGGSAGAAIVVASTSGTTATPGTDGANGVDGKNGLDGISGTDGLDGADGVAGPRGDSGAPGAIGKSGTNGHLGADGTNGKNGTNGVDGTNGADGDPGPAGAQGPAGDPGATGAQGPAGTAPPAVFGDAFGSSQMVSDEGTIKFQSTLENSAVVTQIQDGFEIFESGYYELSYSVRPTPGQVSTVGLSSDTAPSFILNLDGSPVETTRVYRPMFNVNVMMILTLKVLVDGATLEYSGYHHLPAGTKVSLQATGNEGLPTSLSASLRVKKLSSGQ